MSSLSHWFRSLKFRWIRFWYYLNGYVKIRYDFQSDEEGSTFPSEVVWSKPLGDDLYQIENVPEDIVDVNLHDVVKCRQEPNGLPVIIEIVRQSGNLTLRVEFREETSAENAVDVIKELRKKHVFYEKGSFKRYMFNVEPEINYETIRDFLKSKEEEGLLWVIE
jgi:hypothetical protein